MEGKELTGKEYWDSRWGRVKLPVEVQEENAQRVIKEILDKIRNVLPKQKNISLLEIGGAPGPWLAYFRKKYQYNVAAIDFSDIGCEKIRENFVLLDLPVNIYNKNLLTDNLSDLPRFDIVCSFGFIEHFIDLNVVIQKHVELLKDNGLLLLGVPNFSGISHWVLKKTSPGIFSTHNIQAMDIDNWRIIEENYGLKPLFKGYIGGFDLRHCRRCANRTLLNRLIRLFFKLFTRLADRIGFLKRYNSRYWSPYLFAVYKKG